jgi:hypothetical protein
LIINLHHQPSSSTFIINLHHQPSSSTFIIKVCSLPIPLRLLSSDINHRHDFNSQGQFFSFLLLVFLTTFLTTTVLQIHLLLYQHPSSSSTTTSFFNNILLQQHPSTTTSFFNNILLQQHPSSTTSFFNNILLQQHPSSTTSFFNNILLQQHPPSTTSNFSSSFKKPSSPQFLHLPQVLLRQKTGFQHYQGLYSSKTSSPAQILTIKQIQKGSSFLGKSSFNNSTFLPTTHSKLRKDFQLSSPAPPFTASAQQSTANYSLETRSAVRHPTFNKLTPALVITCKAPASSHHAKVHKPTEHNPILPQ